MIQKFLIIVLLFLNIYLVYQVTLINEEKKNLQDDFINVTQIEDNISVVDSSLINSFNSTFLLKFFFSEDCPSCIVKELDNTKKLLASFPNRVSVIYVSPDGSNLNQNVNFDYRKVSYEEFAQLFSKRINLSGPASFVVSENGSVIYHFQMSVYNIGLSDPLLNKIRFLLENT